MAEAEILQDSKIDETRRSHTVTIGIGGSVTDQIEAKFSLRALDAPICFTDRRPKGANFHLRIHGQPGWNLLKGLLKNSDAFAHLQDPHHQSIVGVAMFAERHPKLKPGVNSVAIHFAYVVVHAARA